MSRQTISLSGIDVKDQRVAHWASQPQTLIGSPPTDTFTPETLWLLPGMFDLSCRLGEPGPPHPASISSELNAARKAGFDTVLMNPDTTPCIDNAAVIEWVEHRAPLASGARLRLLGALTTGLLGTALTSMESLRRSGVVGLGQGLAGLPAADVLLNALRYASGLGIRVHLLAQDPVLHDGIAAAGEKAAQLGLKGIPVAAETAALGLVLSLVEECGGAVHIGRVSSASGVTWLRWAKERGLPITADVSLAQLLLNDAALDEFNPYARLDPPLRNSADQQALIAGVADGTIDAICSDHQPHPADQYQQPLASIPAGAVGFDGFLPLVLNHPALANIPLGRKLDAISAAPGRIIGIDENPIGVLFDPTAKGALCAESIQSACHNTPLIGSSLQGACVGYVDSEGVHLFSS